MSVLGVVVGVGPVAGGDRIRSFELTANMPIVLNGMSASRWDTLKVMAYSSLISKAERAQVSAARYLEKALTLMLGVAPTLRAGPDVSAGYVLTRLEDAPANIQALAAPYMVDTAGDTYSNVESFCVYTETARTWFIGKSYYGIAHAVVEFLDACEFEVLNVGQNWFYFPEFTAPIKVAMRKGGRPSSYIRGLFFVGGQPYGQGTLSKWSVPLNSVSYPLPDPTDVPIEQTLELWATGTRTLGQSMPGFPGHSLQKYHAAVIKYMYDNDVEIGFLAVAHIGVLPAYDPQYAGHLWVEKPSGNPARPTVYWGSATSSSWVLQTPTYVTPSLDVSVDWVRAIIWADFYALANAGIVNGATYVFGCEPEDGAQSDAVFKATVNDAAWYKTYRQAQGNPIGLSYPLDGFKGSINQPTELWWSDDIAGETDNAQSDHSFALACWLLSEWDLAVGSDLAPGSTRPKRECVRTSLFSYNYHDVPPNYRLDSRVQVQIADYPKHRGVRKWACLQGHEPTVEAFSGLLPGVPSADYKILSYCNGSDVLLSSFTGTPQASQVVSIYQGLFENGVRAFANECDVNGGRLGLFYYLVAKYLWNSENQLAELLTLRDRWILRAFGPDSFALMQDYFDLIRPESWVASPYHWARAVSYLDQASALAPAGQYEKRFDDFKLFWYWYYLKSTGVLATDPLMKTFVWKAQMSCQVAMWMVCRNIYDNNDASANAGAPINTGSAHYTHAESVTWWNTVKAYWPLPAVTLFADSQLIDGTLGADVDLNDLVQVSEFAPTQGAEVPYLFFGRSSGAQSLITTARALDTIGLQIFWAYNAGSNDYTDLDVLFGVERYNNVTKIWESVVTFPFAVHSVRENYSEPNGSGMIDGQVAKFSYQVTQAGTYRMSWEHKGGAAFVAPIDYDLITRTCAETRGLTWTTPPPKGYTQRTAYPTMYFYIPKNMQYLDWDTWGAANLTIYLYRTLPSGGFTASRTVTLDDAGVPVANIGTHRLTLDANEKGTVARVVQTADFTFPWLYSIPQLSARSSSRLLVPRQIAIADGLTII